MKSKKPTLVSLFAGAGGLDLGLEEAGFTTLMVNEIGAHACETLRQNKVLSNLSRKAFDGWFENQITNQRCHRAISNSDAQRLRSRLRDGVGNHDALKHAVVVEKDIRSLSSEEILEITGLKPGELTLVAGGPPCQPFSRAGKRETVEAADGRLFLEFVRVVRDLQPRWFLFENVKGLTQSRTLVPYIECKNCETREVAPFEHRDLALSGGIPGYRCHQCGSENLNVYSTDVRGGSLEIILNEFQKVGYRCHHRVLNAADYGVPQSRERLFIVGSRDGEDFEWPKSTHIEKPADHEVTEQSQIELFPLAAVEPKKPWLTVKDLLWKNGHPEFGRLDQSKAVIWVKNVVRPHAEPVCWTLDRPSPTVGAHQAAKLAVAPYGVPEEQLARQQWHTLGRRQSDLPPVHVDHAMLADDELLLLQTFPSYWYLFGTRMERAFQIGNAVPPRLASAVGKAIIAASGVTALAGSSGGDERPEKILNALVSGCVMDVLA